MGGDLILRVSEHRIKSFARRRLAKPACRRAELTNPKYRTYVFKTSRGVFLPRSVLSKSLSKLSKVRLFFLAATY